MIRAEDLKNGSVKLSKAHTSILPYLRAEQASKVDPKAETLIKGSVSKNTQDREEQKTALKYIHPSATEAELEAMADL